MCDYSVVLTKKEAIFLIMDTAHAHCSGH